MNEEQMLIIGAGGQLGKALCAKYPGAQTTDVEKLDITNASSVENYDWSKVKVILNVAAYTNVDGAETSEGRVAAWQVNASAVANLAKQAIKHDLLLVHISTDYVFDGTNDKHEEDEPFSPLGVYAASKAAGDIIASTVEKHYILRTSWLIGDGKNFIRTMLELGRNGTNPTVVSDQIGRPTFTSELVRAIYHLLSTSPQYGTYNVTNTGDSVSWADLARAAYSEAGVNATVTDTTTADYFASKPGVAPRPLNSTLDLSKIQDAGFTSRDWREDLRKYINKL